jgi:hypothetical protein
MIGHNAFDQMVAETTKTRVAFEKNIPLEDYELWQKDVIWDCLHGLRYGQSFCNRFSVSDNLLYYITWPSDQIDNYIKKNYLERT